MFCVFGQSDNTTKKTVSATWQVVFLSFFFQHVVGVFSGFFSFFVTQLSLVAELIFLAIYSVDLGLKGFSYDKCHIHWPFYCIVILAVVNFIFVFVFLIFKTTVDNPNTSDTVQALNDIFTIMRIIRPLYLIQRSRDLKTLSKSIISALSSLVQLVAMIVIFWIIFASIGFALFWEQDTIAGQNNHFSSFGQSWWSLLILQTTANFPDIMLENYTNSEWVAWYFLIYNLLGIYFLMSLVLAVIYNHYSNHITNQSVKIQERKTRAKQFSFDALIQSRKYRIKKDCNKDEREKEIENEFVIYYKEFSKICTAIRRDFKDSEQKKRMRERYCRFTMQDTDELLTVNGKIDATKDKGMNFAQFDDNIEDWIKTYIREDIEATQEACVALMLADLNQNHSMQSDRLSWYWYKLRYILIKFWNWTYLVKIKICCCCVDDEEEEEDEDGKGEMFTNASNLSLKKSDDNGGVDIGDDEKHMITFEISTNLFVTLFVMASVAVVLIDIYVFDSNSDVLEVAETIIIWLFVIEVLFRIIAFTLTGYLKNNFNKLDFIVSTALFIFDIILKKYFLSTVFLLRALRLLKILRVTKVRVVYFLLADGFFFCKFVYFYFFTFLLFVCLCFYWLGVSYF